MREKEEREKGRGKYFGDCASEFRLTRSEHDPEGWPEMRLSACLGEKGRIGFVLTEGRWEFNCAKERKGRDRREKAIMNDKTCFL
jgi:hypothetical protein